MFILNPMVAGELGPRTAFDSPTGDRVSQVEYVLDGPNADDLVEAYPIYLVSDALAHRLECSGLSGFTFAPALIAKSANYEALEPRAPHKNYQWFVVGDESSNDCWIDEEARLCVSERMIAVLREFDLKLCDVYERGSDA